MANWTVVAKREKAKTKQETLSEFWLYKYKIVINRRFFTILKVNIKEYTYCVDRMKQCFYFLSWWFFIYLFSSLSWQFTSSVMRIKWTFNYECCRYMEHKCRPQQARATAHTNIVLSSNRNWWSWFKNMMLQKSFCKE